MQDAILYGEMGHMLTTAVPSMLHAALQSAVSKHRPRKAFYQPGTSETRPSSGGQAGFASRTGSLSPAAQPLGSSWRHDYPKAQYPAVDVEALDLN